MLYAFGSRRRFSDLSEAEILALAISSEEDDARIYATYAEQLRHDYPATAAIFDGMQRYTEIPPPILAIYALPPAPGTVDAALAAKGEAIAKAFEAALPNAHVVRIPQANHFVFMSHEADVLREIDAFLGTLK